MSIRITGTVPALDTTNHPEVSQDFTCFPREDGTVECFRVRDGMQQKAVATSLEEAREWVREPPVSLPSAIDDGGLKAGRR